MAVNPESTDLERVGPENPFENGRQQALHEALLEKSPALASFYWGGLFALRQGANPERFPQSAQSIRELIEKIPEYYDVPIKAQHESLKNKVIELLNIWETTLKRSSNYSNGNWEGQIDRPLKDLLGKKASFFDWFKQHHPLRRAEVAATLQRIDQAGRAIPKILEDSNVDIWMNIREYFVTVAHHGRQTNYKEICQWLESLETFILDRLRPRTFENLSTIDTLIKEGESND